MIHTVIDAGTTPNQIGVAQDGGALFPYTRCCLWGLNPRDGKVVCGKCGTPQPGVNTFQLVYDTRRPVEEIRAVVSFWTGLPESVLVVTVDP